jgi:hypothetical protein
MHLVAHTLQITHCPYANTINTLLMQVLAVISHAKMCKASFYRLLLLRVMHSNGWFYLSLVYFSLVCAIFKSACTAK